MANFSTGTVVAKASIQAGVADYFDSTVCKAPHNQSLGKTTRGTVIVRHRSTVLPPNGPRYCHQLASTTNSSSLYGWMLMLGNGTGKALFRVHAGSSTADGVADSAGAALNDGAIHTTTATWDLAAGGRINLYVDGTLQATATHPTAIDMTLGTPTAMIIGGSQDTFWAWLNGHIESLYLFDRELSAGEVSSFQAAPYQLWERPGTPAYALDATSPILSSARPQVFCMT